MTIGDLIKAAIKSVAYSLCLPYFTMLLLRRQWCAGRGLAAGRAAAPVWNWWPPPSRQILAVTRAGDTSQQSAINKRVSRVTCHTRAVSPSSLPWWRSTPRPSTACCPASTADSSSPKLRPVTVNVRRKGRTM